MKFAKNPRVCATPGCGKKVETRGVYCQKCLKNKIIKSIDRMRNEQFPGIKILQVHLKESNIIIRMAASENLKEGNKRIGIGRKSGIDSLKKERRVRKSSALGSLRVRRR